MQKSSFSVIFVTHNGKAKADGRAPIVARITVNGEMTHFSTRQTISPERWLPRTYRTVGQTREEKQINSILDELQTAIKHKYDAMFAQGAVITATKLKSAILHMDESGKTLMELCDIFIKNFEALTISRGYGQESLFRYQLAQKRMQEFLKSEYKVDDVPLVDINKRMLDKMYLWLVSEKKLKNNTATKFIHRCSSIYRMALDNGWVQANPFKQLKLHLDKVDRGYLTQQELVRVMQKEFATNRLNLVRDLFIFGCYTGFAYVDVSRLTKDMLEERGDGSMWICTKRQKTDVPVNIPLLDIPKMIIEKYAGQVKGDKLLPVPSNQKMNDYLKEIAGICEINKTLSYHVARHTFATTITLLNGVPIESVSKMLGHTNIRTTQIYARITDQKVSRDMDILAEKLNNTLPQPLLHTSIAL